MERLQQIRELRRILKALREAGRAFRDNLPDIEKVVEQDKFPTYEGLKTWNENLTAWTKNSNACAGLCIQLFDESLPNNIAAVEEILDAEEKKVKEANVSGQAEKFLHIVTNNVELKKILREHQTKLKKLLARKRQTAQLKAALEPYAKFVNAAEEDDLGKKFSAGTELREIFGDDFIGRGLFGRELTSSIVEKSNDKPAVYTRGKVIPETPATQDDIAKLFVAKGALLKEKDFDVWRERFTMEKNERNKDFSASRFKRDFSNAEMLKPVLRYVTARGMLWSPGFCPKKMPPNVAENIAQMFCAKGYFRVYSFETLGTFWGFTIGFAEFLRTDSGKKFIFSSKHGAKMEFENPPFITDNMKVALTRMFFFRVHEIAMEQGDYFGDVDFFSQAFRTEFVGAGEVVDLFIGCFWDDTKDCADFFVKIKNYFGRGKNVKRIFVVGLTPQHARKVFDIIDELLADYLPQYSARYIYTFNDNEFYRRDDMEKTSIEEIWQKPDPDDDPDSDADKDAEENIVVQKSATPPMDSGVKEKIVGDVKELIIGKKFYCATAYLKVKSLEIKEVEYLYRQLAFALDDPLLNESYGADVISILATQEDDAFNEALVTAAAVRALFYNDFGSDYGTPVLHALLKSFELVRSNEALAELIGDLRNFKADVMKGVDFYADYRTKDRQAAEENLAKVIRDAEDYYMRFFEKRLTDRSDNEIFIRMEQKIFSRNGDLGQIFGAIKDKNEARSKDTLKLVKDFLEKIFIEAGAAFNATNLDDDKLNQFIDDEWYEACGKKGPGKLTSRLRNNITKNLERAFEIMCEWVNCAEILGADGEDEGIAEYKKIRSRLLDNIKAALKNLKSNDAGEIVVAETLEEISARLDGSYNRLKRKYFYAEFLCGDKVTLDENYLPNLEINISDGTQNNITEQIKQHAALKLPGFEKRIEQIFEAGGDDFGTAQLIDNYLKDTGGKSFIGKKEYDVEKCINSAAKDAPRYRENFIGGLELAQSYGQFDSLPDGEKEKIFRLVENCYKYAEESKNFGVFFRVKKYWEDVIEDNAAKRGEILKQELTAAVESYKKVADNFNEAELAESVAEIGKIIEARNFTAAQGLIFKLSRGELYKNFDDEEDTPLVRFLDPEEYSDCYNRIKDSGDSLENLIGKKMSTRDKVSRAKLNLIKNWITNSVGEDKMSNLLELLGFSVEEVHKISLPASNAINFRVKILGTGQTKYNYPIAAFGSESEVSGFNVACLFGKFDEKNLIEKFKELGNANHTLIFLDYALDLPTRRRLAKEIKLDKNLTKVFAVIDRVAIMYLIKNCAAQLGTKRITDTLMSLVMPFAKYQPYIWSPRTPLPPEMFIGRENEINEVMNHGGVNIVCGGRQLGKSALLKMACRKVEGNNNERAIFIDIDDKNYREAALIVSRELNDKNFFTEPVETDDWEELAHAIRNRLSSDKPTKIPYFLLMLDEADKFIESCAENNYSPIVALAKIQQENYDGSRFKFVIAGLRNIIRFEREKTFGNNSILPTLKSLTVKPFDVEDARKLLEVPLRYLGLYFPDNKKDSLILTILETANYFPSLIQLYCEKLITALFEPSYAGYDANTPIYRISEEHIKKVLADREFTKDIKTKIEITLRLGEDKYYFVIANLLAHLYYNQNSVVGYSPKDILNAAVTFGLVKEPFLPNTQEKIGALMEELCELNILRKTGKSKYLFSRQRILRIVGTLNEVEEALLKLMTEADNG